MSNPADQIAVNFKSRCEDWTQAYIPHHARVIFCPYVEDAQITELCGAFLSESEMKRSGAFITADLAARFSQRRAFQRYFASLMLQMPAAFSSLHFERNENGRPVLQREQAGCFSFSSCRQGFIGAWSNTKMVGIDIEDTSRKLEVMEMANSLFAPSEIALLEREQDHLRRKEGFLKLWCLKEAVAKAMGEGVSKGMNRFEFEHSPTPRLRGDADSQISAADVKCQVVCKPEIVSAIVTVSVAAGE